MSRHRILGILFVALLTAPVARAQVNVAASKDLPALTLNDAVDEALGANVELVALRREYEAARAAPTQERYLSPPMLEAQIWGWPVTTLNPARTDMYMFMAEQALPGRGKRAARTRVGEREADVAQQRIVVRANEILDEVRQAYADIALGRATVELFHEQASVLRDAADAATLQYAAGHTGQHDTVRSLVELSRVEGDRIAWQGRIREAEARLNTLLGRPVAAAIGPLVATAVRDVPVDAERIAVERHPAIALAQAEIAREEAELGRLRGERRPDFVVGGGYMLQPGEAGAWTARAGISWPNAPWSRSRLDASIDAQAKRVETAKARLDGAASSVRRFVQEATIRLDTARQRAALIQTTVLPHVEHSLEVARVAYSTNRGEFTDLIDTQRVLLSARMDAISAQTDVERALSDLERAIGDVPDASPAVAARFVEQPR